MDWRGKQINPLSGDDSFKFGNTRSSLNALAWKERDAPVRGFQPLLLPKCTGDWPLHEVSLRRIEPYRQAPAMKRNAQHE